jgi:beta-lactam-binding protein with PASTA domain
VDGASGWNFNDSIRGSNSVLCDPPGEIAECLVGATATEPGMELTAAGAAKIGAAPGAGQVSLTQLMGPLGFNQDLNDPAIPGVKGVGFMGGDILLGGIGSDILEGKLGDDLMDGDRWFNVQLKYRLNGETTDRFADHLTELQDFIFSDPQQLNPGNISIVKTIVTPTVPAADCGTASPQNCDTAVFNFPLVDFDITNIPLAGGGSRVIVTHVPAAKADIPFAEGTDTLLNIERLQFTDANIAVPITVNATVPSIAGLDEATATAVLLNAGFSVGIVGAVNSDTVPIDLTVRQSPTAGSLLVVGGRVSFDLSLGPLAPVTVPLVTGLTFGGASQVIALAGLTVGVTTSANSNTVPAGSVISQDPAANAIVSAGSAVALVVSSGPAFVAVPAVAGLTQAAATTAITGAGLVLGPVTTASSPTVPSGSVISSNPAAGTAVLPGSPVAIVVSTGPAAVAGLIAAFGFEETAGTTAIDSSVNPRNGTFGGGAAAPTRVLTGKFGRAVSFDGGDNISVIDGAAGTKLDLTTGMTLEAWVNPSSMSGWESVAYKERGGAGTGLLSYALYAHDGAPQAGGFAGPSGYLRPAPALSTTDQGVREAAHTPLGLNTWSHIAVTYDGANMRLYVNGALVATKPQTGTIATGNQPLRIGNSNASISEGFNGLIDEIRIYNRALSATEIGTDMNTPIVP